jgi:hypothetical protein
MSNLQMSLNVGTDFKAAGRIDAVQCPKGS